MTAGGARSTRNGPAGNPSADDPPRAAREDPEDATSQDYFNEPSRAAARGRAMTASDSGDDAGRVTDAIERLSDRIESAESRQALAIAGVERSVRDVIARIDASERDQMQTTARVENAVQAVRTDSKRLAERLQRLESEGPGARSVEALRALEAAVSKVASHVHDSERRSQESLAEIRARMERFDAAEGATVNAIRELRTTCNALDERLSLVDNDGHDGIERLAENLSQRVEQVRAELAQQLAAAADARFDRVEEALARMSEHVRAAEQRSAGAIDRMGREVLEVAQTLSRRVQSVEQHSVELGDRVGADMSRIATAVEARLVRSDTIQAQALEKLGDEIARITERLADRITNAERRSAEAIDDIGEQVARVTERISHRHERYTSELADRIRQSEDRTAKLLDEARSRLDGRVSEPLTPAAQPAGPPFLAAPDPERDEKLFLDAPFPAHQPARAFEPLRATPVPRAPTVRVAGQAPTARSAQLLGEVTEPAIPARPDSAPPPEALAPEPAAPVEPEPPAPDSDPPDGPPPATLSDHAPHPTPGAGSSADDESDVARSALAPAPSLPEDEALFSEAPTGAELAAATAEQTIGDVAADETGAAEDPANEAPNKGPWDLADLTTDAASRVATTPRVTSRAAEPIGAADATTSTSESEAPPAPRWTWRAWDDAPPSGEGTDPGSAADALFEAAREARERERDAAPEEAVGGDDAELEPVELEPNIGFDDEDDFDALAAAEGPRLPTYRFPSTDRVRGLSATSSEPPPALTTRDIIDRARAAARSAHERDQIWRPTTAANESMLASVSGVVRRARAPSGLSGLLAASLVAAVGIAGGGFLLFEGKPDRGSASDQLAANGAPRATPIAAMALAPKPANGPAAKDMTSDYSQAVADVTAAKPGGLAHLQKLADAGYAPAQFYLAELYQDGKAGLKKDPTQSRHWLERAADGGDRTAMHNLALDEHEGIGGARDAATAAEWFRRAADLGLLDSQYNLAALYERGDGVVRNLAEAYKWYLVAGRAGDPEARAGAQRVRAALSADERQVAERAAAEFQPSQPPEPGTAQPGGAPANPDLVTAERALNQLGYYQGPTDGSTSPAIHLAIAAYQRDQGLPITGSPDSATLAKLGKQ